MEIQNPNKNRLHGSEVMADRERRRLVVRKPVGELSVAAEHPTIGQRLRAIASTVFDFLKVDRAAAARAEREEKEGYIVISGRRG